MKDFSKVLNELPNKTKPEGVEACVDQLFFQAFDRMESDKDKQTVFKLRQLLREVEHNLYEPKDKLKDAFFFPNPHNVHKMENYINRAKKSIDLSIFSFTHDVLYKAIVAAHKRGIKVRIISDDEAIKQPGADA
jgi:mitochondrial cardiolipin hydrolase